MDRLRTPVRFSGEIGSYGELYSVSGRERRRPSSTGRLFLRSSLELFGTVTVGLDLSYATESGSTAGLGTSRQPFNQIGIAPEWSWGRAYLGAFSDSYSSLTWDGVRMRGLGFNVNPGPVRLAAFYGRSQSAALGGAIDGAFRRDVSGGRIGFGRRSETGDGGFLDVVFLRAADDPSSLPLATEPEPATSTAVVDNEFAVTPQENIVIAAVTRVPFWQGRLVWSGEAAASVHSRDRRAPVLTDDALDEYAGLLRSFITPRASTYGDIAHNGKLELRNLPLPGSTTRAPRTLSAAVGYRYIGAGYVSLGLASLPADQQAVTADVSVRFRQWNASLRGMQQHDNLLGQKLATTTRYRLAGSASIRLSRAFSSTLRASLNTVGNDTDDVARQVDFASWLVGMSHSVSLRDRRLRALALNYGYQQAGDAAPQRADSELRAHDTSVRATIQAARNLTITPAIGIALSKSASADWQARHTYSLAGHFRASSRLTSSASLSNSRLNSGGSIQGAVSARYQLTTSDLVTLGIRSNRVSGLQTETGYYHENRVTLNWARSIR
ncbi:MAG TPA: hypothetical protein VFZ24_06535 [Longimicrobiales bacterium]